MDQIKVDETKPKYGIDYDTNLNKKLIETFY